MHGMRYRAGLSSTCVSAKRSTISMVLFWGYFEQTRQISLSKPQNCAPTLIWYVFVRILFCGSNIWTQPRSRGSTKRAYWRPGGDPRVRSVRQANQLARRVAYMMEYHFAKNIHYVLENPLSSLLWRLKCIRRRLRKHRAIRVVTHLGCYGASTLKPVS